MSHYYVASVEIQESLPILELEFARNSHAGSLLHLATGFEAKIVAIVQLDLYHEIEN